MKCFSTPESFYSCKETQEKRTGENSIGNGEARRVNLGRKKEPESRKRDG